MGGGGGRGRLRSKNTEMTNCVHIVAITKSAFDWSYLAALDLAPCVRLVGSRS